MNPRKNSGGLAAGVASHADSAGAAASAMIRNFGGEKIKRAIVSLGLASFAVGLAGCATRTVEPRNLSLLKEEIVGYVDSGLYLQQVGKVSREASAWIERRAKAGTSLPREGRPVRLAVVFDIDETMLSNFSHMRRMDFGYQAAAWEAWVAQGEAPAIEPVREIYRLARRLGIEVIFVTGRREHDRPGTEKNLRAVGVDDYSRIFFKPDASKETTEKFKTAVRALLVEEGCIIVANIGDQESDLSGGYAERTFKLPDPFYVTK
jgi:HAD superfamily, subfamily IIIB (Acid phosphatase)